MHFIHLHNLKLKILSWIWPIPQPWSPHLVRRLKKLMFPGWTTLKMMTLSVLIPLQYFFILVSAKCSVSDLPKNLWNITSLPLSNPHLLFFTETQVWEATESNPFYVPSYFVLIFKPKLIVVFMQRYNLLSCPWPWIFRIFHLLAVTLMLFSY